MLFHFRVLAFPANAIMALVLVSVGNVGCSHGFSRNDETELLISLKRICSKTSVQVVKFHRGRYLILSSFVPACRWELSDLIAYWFMVMWSRGENQTNGQHVFFIYHQHECKMSSSSPDPYVFFFVSSIWNRLELLHTAEQQQSQQQVFRRLWPWVKTGLTQLSLAGV